MHDCGRTCPLKTWFLGAGSCDDPLFKLQAPYPVEGLHERMNPLVVSKHTVHYAPTRSDDLYRYPDQPVEKPAELHCQELISMFPFTHQQSKPRLQSPCQGCHDHIRPVGYQRVHRHSQSVDSVLELLNEVFLVASIITEPHQFRRTQIGDVGNIEKVPNIIEEPYLAFLHRKALAQDNDPIGSLAFCRSIVELGKDRKSTRLNSSHSQI